jgi:hypothetical protein
MIELKYSLASTFTFEHKLKLIHNWVGDNPPHISWAEHACYFVIQDLLGSPGIGEDPRWSFHQYDGFFFRHKVDAMHVKLVLGGQTLKQLLANNMHLLNIRDISNYCLTRGYS